VEKRKGKQRAIEVELNPEVEKLKRSQLLGKYTVRILFGWNDNKFENEYLKKLEKNWARWKGKEIEEGEASSSGGRTLKGEYVKIEEGGLDLFYFSFHFLFYFQFIFRFSIFRITRVIVDWS